MMKGRIKMSDDDKFGVCGFISIITMILSTIAFKEWGFPIWLGVILSFSISLVVFIFIYHKCTKKK